MLLDTELIPNLSAAEEIAYTEVVNGLYAKMQGKASIVNAAWMEQRSQRDGLLRWRVAPLLPASSGRLGMGRKYLLGPRGQQGFGTLGKVG